MVSIVITTKNEERNIGNCLKSIICQHVQDIEMIVVDNQSTDRTKEIAREYTELVFDKGPERSAQRNYGMITIAKGEYVMFVDADMIFSPTLIEDAIKAMEKNPDWVALHIPEVVLGRRYFSKVRRFERSFYNGTVIDGARLFKKEAFVQAGGFDEGMSGPEDWDIDKKIKRQGLIGLLHTKPALETVKDWEMLSYIAERGVDARRFGSVIYHNESEFDLKAYLGKKGYYAKSFDTYIEKWGKSDPDIKKQLGVGYRYFSVFLENGKFIKLLAHPLLTFGMYYLRLLVGLRFLFRQKSQ